MRSVKIGFGILILLILGGCCGFISNSCPPCPTLPAPPQITGRIHCSDLLTFLRQVAPDVKYPGVTSNDPPADWFDLTTEQEYYRTVPQIVANLSSCHIWIVVGEIKKWGPRLAVGWTFDSTNQKDLVAMVAGSPGTLKLLLYDPELKQFVTLSGRKLFLIRI